MSLELIEDVLNQTIDIDAIADRQEVAERLEYVLELCNKAANEGNELVPDAIYDTLRDRLRQLSPDSYLLHQVWSDDSEETLDEDLDRLLLHYPMLSIQTVKDYSDDILMRFLKVYKEGYTNLRFVFSMKLNGFGIRVITDRGEIVKATTRGRNTQGRDITRQLRVILGSKIEGLASYGLVEIRGELLLPFHNLDRARTFNPNIKTAFTGVSSMVRESATDSEVALLDFVAYNIYSDDLHFNYLSDKLEFLEELGFITPKWITGSCTPSSILQDIKDAESYLAMVCEDGYPYFTDGFIVDVDHIETAATFGIEEQYKLSNLAMKVGYWEQNAYSGTVRGIAWEEGKSQITPVALVEGDEAGKGVLTAFGNRVSRVPLYTPYNIMLIEAYVGNTIYFKYGGEAGVVPTTREGKLLKDFAKEVKQGSPKLSKRGKDVFISYDDFDNDVDAWDAEELWS